MEDSRVYIDGEREQRKGTKSVKLQARTYATYPDEADTFAGQSIHDDRGRFVAGHHCGRPMMPVELQQRVRSLCPSALETVRTIMESSGSKEADRLRAAEILLDRGYGRPAQAVDVSGSAIPQVVIVGDVPD